MQGSMKQTRYPSHAPQILAPHVAYVDQLGLSDYGEGLGDQPHRDQARNLRRTVTRDIYESTRRLTDL
jgi:hypothetical protein